MIDYVDELYKGLNSYVTTNSIYSPYVVNNRTRNISEFPTIALKLSDNPQTNNSTIDRIEFYDKFYFTINIYTTDKTMVVNNTNVKVPANVIAKELTQLTNDYMSGCLNMKRTACKPIDNFENENIYRMYMEFQCEIGNRAKNIIRS